MKKQFHAIFLKFLAFAILSGCCSVNKSKNNGIKEGISGSVTEVSGNQMPGPGVKRTAPKPVKTTLYVYALTNLTHVERKGNEPLYSVIRSKLISTVETDEQGHFIVALPPGHYSLFTKVNGHYFSNLFDSENNIFPVRVEENKVAAVDFVININAYY